MNRTRPFAIATLCTLALLGAARGDLDPEARQPYRLTVVLQIEDHPLLTPFFRESLRRDLEAVLKADLGDLADRVQVEELDPARAEKAPPLWRAFAEQGFAALDTFSRLTGEKTHFVRLAFEGGRYRLESRQHDGSTGFASPLVRRRETHEPSLVARLAALMVVRDFGVVGTVGRPEGGQPGASEVTVTLKGGQLGVPMDRWVSPGEVFALVQVREAGGDVPPAGGEAGPREGQRVPDVLLQVAAAPKGGAVTCKLYQRYQGNPMPRHSRVAGYRCIKLGTTEAPLRLQLVDDRGRPLRSADANLSVRVHDRGFITTPMARGDAWLEDGVFVSRPLSHAAFAQVIHGTEVRAQIPIPILDDRVVVAPFRIDAQAEKQARLDRAARELLGRITDARRVQIGSFRDLTALEKAGNNAQALERAKADLKALESDAGALAAEIDQLTRQAEQELSGKAKPTALAAAVQQLDLLRQSIGELRKHVGELEAVVKKENDPKIAERDKRLNAKLREAELLVQQAEFDRALTLYDEILKEADTPEVRKKRDELRSQWAVKDEAHKQAREFVYGTWAKMESYQDLEKHLPEARKAVAKLKEVGDRLTLRKMDLTAVPILTRLEEQTKPLLSSADEEDRATLMQIQKVIQEAGDLMKEVNEFLQKG
ncbi:MAG TPA: hypothetical protein VIL46_05950 [Gemmataceae bacterium]